MPRLIIPKQLPGNVPSSALEATKRLIKTGRQVYGVPAASLTWGVDGKVSEEVGAGIEGEKKTALILGEWVKKHPTALVFHSVMWPGVEGDTDHVIVIGKQVILVDSKRWKSKRTYSVTAKGEIMRGKVHFPEGKVKMNGALASWRKIIGSRARVSGLVCVAQDEVFVPYDQNWKKAPYRLVTAEKLDEFLDNFVTKNAPPEKSDFVDLGVVMEFISRLVKPRDRRAEVINSKALGRY